MNKGQRRGVTTIANEQRIEEKNSSNYKWTKDKKEEQHQLLLKMYKGQKRGIVVVATNEQMIKKRSFLFFKKNSSDNYCKWTKDKKEGLFV